MNDTLIGPPRTTEFFGFNEVEPEDLLTYTPDYISHLEDLKQYLQTHEGQLVPLLVQRIIKGSSSFEGKILTGRVGKINNNQFIFSTCEDLHGTYDHVKHLTLRFDNPLGDIPMLPDATDLKLLQISNKLQEYRNYLITVDNLLKECVGKMHTAKLYYRYSVNEPTFRNGNYCVECKITRVNKSNIEYRHFRTFAYVDPDHRYCDIVPRDGIDRYIAPNSRYLQKVTVLFGAQHQINGHDDED